MLCEHGLTKFSSGFRGSVYRFSSPDSGFPSNRANLVKLEQNADRKFYARQFLNMKIAGSLFPENFPEVIACGVIFDGEDTWIDHYGVTYSVPIHKLFSREVLVPDEHRQFCKDIDLDETHSLKISTCECPGCADHRTLHTATEDKMRILTDRIAAAGISVPHDDPTDWCVDSETGQVIFFEVERINLTALEQFTIEKGLHTKQIGRLIAGLKKIS